MAYVVVVAVMVGTFAIVAVALHAADRLSVQNNAVSSLNGQDVCGAFEDPEHEAELTDTWASVEAIMCYWAG